MAKAKTPTDRPKVGVQPNKVTNAAKIRAIKSLLPMLPNPKGQLASVALSARSPFVANVAWCVFRDAAFVDAHDDAVVYRSCPEGGFLPALIIRVRVFQPAKAHILTIYLTASENQTYLLTHRADSEVFANSGESDGLVHNAESGKRQTFQVGTGSQTILYAFLPTMAGMQRLMLEPDRPTGQATKAFTFFRAEFDVLT